MFACIPLNSCVVMNNECKYSKKINIYIEYLKGYVKKFIRTSTMFACIL